MQTNPTYVPVDPDTVRPEHERYLPRIERTDDLRPAPGTILRGNRSGFDYIVTNADDETYTELTTVVRLHDGACFRVRTAELSLLFRNVIFPGRPRI